MLHAPNPPHPTAAASIKGLKSRCRGRRGGQRERSYRTASLPGGIEAFLPTRLTPDHGQNVAAYKFGDGFGQAARTLYAFGNHASPLRAWREEQMPVGHGDQVVGDMPHNWASAEFSRLVRHSLILDNWPGQTGTPALRVQGQSRNEINLSR